MELTDINVNSYPNSEKIYVDGSIYPIKVGMRRIKLTPTVKIVDGEKVMTENTPVVVNDTSGVYTDPNVEVDINKGIPRLREKWIEQRADTALQDGISSEYRCIARRYPIPRAPQPAHGVAGQANHADGLRKSRCGDCRDGVCGYTREP